MSRLFPGLSGYEAKARYAGYMKAMFEDIIADHKKTFVPDSKPRVTVQQLSNEHLTCNCP